MVTREKILLISHYVPPILTGGPIVLYRLFKTLPADSYVIFTSRADRKNAPIDEKLVLPCKYYYCSGISPTVRQTKWKRVLEWLLVPIMIWQCVNVIRKEKVTRIVVCPSVGTCLLTACVAHKLTGIPLYLYMLDLFEENKHHGLRGIMAGIIEPYSMRTASNIFVISEAMRDHYYSKYRIRAILLPHPIDLDSAKPSHDRNPRSIMGYNKHKIVFTGRIYEAHLDAVRNLTRAVAGLHNVEFHIYTSMSKLFLKRHEIIGENIYYHKFTPLQDVIGVQQDADYLFLPMAFDSPYQHIIKTASPAKLPEYLLSGRPIIVHAPPSSYVSWYAKNFGWGLVVDKSEPILLKEAVLNLINNEQLQVQLVKNARRTASLHGIERVVELFRGGLT